MYSIYCSRFITGTLNTVLNLKEIPPVLHKAYQPKNDLIRCKYVHIVLFYLTDICSFKEENTAYLSEIQKQKLIHRE